MKIQTPKIQIKQNPYVTVTWNWHNQNEGIVEWIFKNNSNEKQEVILLRGAIDKNGTVLAYYYFGNAYWVDYLFLGITKWQRNNTTLKNNENPPIAVIQIGDKYLIAFEFTLAPNTTWSVLEGGFINGLQPYNPIAVQVNYLDDYQMCIGYDEKQVIDYIKQTEIPVIGYEPNPSTFKTSIYVTEAPYIELFKDKVKKGRCSLKECVKKIRNYF